MAFLLPISTVQKRDSPLIEEMGEITQCFALLMSGGYASHKNRETFSRDLKSMEIECGTVGVG